MSGGEASAPADATPPDFCARRSSLEVFLLFSRRFPLFALSLFLALLLVPSRAYAWDVQPKGVLYSTDLDGSRVGYVVSAYNQFDAACYAMGKDPNTISTEVKQKLSDSNYGGMFYDYAQSFFTQSGGLENVPTWVPAYIILISELGDLVLSDYQGVWYSTATSTLYDGAMVDFVRVLNGEDLGGGSVVTGYTEYDLMCCDLYSPSFSQTQANDRYCNAISASIDSSGNVTVGSSVMKYSYFTNSNYYVSSARCYVSPSVQSFINDVVADGKKVVVNVGTDLRSDINNAQIYVADDFNIVYGTTADGIQRTIFYMTNGYYWSVRNSRSTYYDSEGVFFVFPDVTPSLTPIVQYGLPMYYASPIISPTYNPPAGTWPEPETPVSPTAPDLPDPVEPTVTPDPVVTDPAPTWPEINITVNPPAVVVPETPEGLDYTALLTLINDNLESIDSYTVAINSSLNSLRSDLVTEFDGVVQSLRNIYSYLQHMDSVLERHCVHLQNKMEDVSVDIQNKMRELVHWLAEQLDFDSESSGNSDLFGILSTINDKLGGGTYEPNPLKDENAYYEWLDDLWDRFLLGDNWQTSASSMSQSFGQLTSRFPFSVPWDIVALFRLFVHDPVTPVFDLPLYYSSEDSATVRVDLSAWDGVASVVRPLVFVIFALNLALLSRHLLAGFGADKGGL